MIFASDNTMDHSLLPLLGYIHTFTSNFLQGAGVIQRVLSKITFGGNRFTFLICCMRVGRKDASRPFQSNFVLLVMNPDILMPNQERR